MTPAPMPRWFWLLPLLAMLAWWPIDPYWQSDDYIALHYASDLQRVGSDFVGPQYGATDVWRFYRPLITASFWLDQRLGGGTWPLSLYSNVLAHGISTLLAALLWRRFVGAGQAFAAALLWALLPSHLATIAWGVGRVDGHTAVWCLLALLLLLRRHERLAAGDRAPAWPLLLTTLLALASKELALVVPPLAVALAALRGGPATPWQRLERTMAVAWPAWLALGLYLPLRWLALGSFGGYSAAQWSLPAIGSGGSTTLANLAVPLRWCGELPPSSVPPAAWLWAAALPPALALLVALWRRPRLVGAAALLAVLASVPMANFLAESNNPHNLRYWYLPTVALAGALVAGGRWVLPAMALALALPLVLVRGAQRTADLQSAAMHRALLREAADAAPSPMFVAGLPHANRLGTTVQLHFGIDRLLAAPFGADAARLYALRPLDAGPSAFRLTADGELPFALPAGSTWFFADATALGRAPDGPQLPPLEVTGDQDGELDLSTPVLFAMAKGERRPGLRTPGVRPAAFRLTLCTANGYLATLFVDHGDGSGSDGTIDILSWFSAIGTPRIGSYAPGAYIGDALDVPTTIDREPVFPVLLEAGTYQLAAGSAVFTPTHRCRRLLRFRFDRDYPQWRRAVQGVSR
ncbi:MAG: hypothetical protein MUC36_05020 [Planctomycetes bacterium]|nr:hypothetical protein [Planctomycetota bacterium]